MNDNNINQGAVKTPHEMLLEKGFKGMRPQRDINIAAIVCEEYAELYAASKLKEKEQEIESLKRECLDVHRDWKAIDDELRSVKAKADKLAEALNNILDADDAHSRIGFGLLSKYVTKALEAYQQTN